MQTERCPAEARGRLSLLRGSIDTLQPRSGYRTASSTDRRCAGCVHRRALAADISGSGHRRVLPDLSSLPHVPPRPDRVRVHLQRDPRSPVRRPELRLIAAEIGDTPGSAGNLAVADCAILQEVERDLTSRAAIADPDGRHHLVRRAGRLDGRRDRHDDDVHAVRIINCVFPDGTSGIVPYGSPSPNNYPPLARCNYLVPTVAACPATAGISHVGWSGLHLRSDHVHTPVQDTARDVRQFGRGRLAHVFAFEHRSDGAGPVIRLAFGDEPSAARASSSSR